MIFVTGAGGFIGFHACLRLLTEGNAVHGLDNFSDYYDVSLKRARIEKLRGFGNFAFTQADISDSAAVADAFDRTKPKRVLHLAAQAGVRYSLENPRVYSDSNLTGFINILEACRHIGAEHLVYASSSSVYGLDATTPFSVHNSVDHPVSFYAATKRANELMAHSYSHLFKLKTTGLRYFTVYGPWGRPDMALFAFTKAILDDQEIQIFGDGQMSRDFTYVDDAIEATCRILALLASANPSWNGAKPDPASSSAPFRLYNIGNRSTVTVDQLIKVLEAALGTKARRKYLPANACEVQKTIADVQSLEKDIGFSPSTPLETGVRNFVTWYRDYYKR